MAEYKEAPPDAPLGVKFMTWLDSRFPATKMWNEHAAQYYGLDRALRIARVLGRQLLGLALGLRVGHLAFGKLQGGKLLVFVFVPTSPEIAPATPT